MTHSLQNVFISYAQADRAHAEGVVRALSHAGVSVWIDKAKIKGGDQWDTEIHKALNEAKVMVLIVSARSLESQWVNYEIGSAIAAGIPVIPVLVGDVKSLPKLLRQVQVIDARGLDEISMGEKVATALERFRGEDDS